MSTTAVRIASLCTGVLLHATDLHSQPQTAATDGSGPQLHAIIAGTILASDTRAPVKGASVRIGDHSTTTNAHGRYTVSGLASGRHVVLAEAPSSRLLPNTKNVTALAGQTVAGQDILLSPPGSVSGRVVGRGSDSLAGAIVLMFSTTIVHGRLATDARYQARADGNGHFRIDNIQPGRYIMRVTPKSLQFSPARTTEPERMVTYLPTYYPLASFQDGASAIDVGPGQALDGLDVAVVRGDSQCVRFKLTMQERLGLEWLWVRLTSTSDIAPLLIATQKIRPEEIVEVCGLGAGSHHLVAFRSSDTQLWFASKHFEVVSRTVTLGDVPVTRSFPITGTVALQNNGERRPPPPGTIVILNPTHRIAVEGEGLEATVDSAGRFEIPAAVRDDYWLRVLRLPRGHYVTEAAYGKTTISSTREPLTALTGELHITLSAQGPTADVMVVDSSDKPVSNATVLCGSDSTPVMSVPLLQGVTDQYGKTSFTGREPATYRCIAAETGVFTKFFTKSADLAAAVASGTRLEFRLGERSTVSLKVGPR